MSERNDTLGRRGFSFEGKNYELHSTSIEFSRQLELYGSGCYFYFESYRLTASKSETSIFIAYFTYK